MTDDPLRRRLEQAGQEHLIAWCNHLDAAQRTRLVSQLKALDLDLLEGLVRGRGRLPGDARQHGAALAGRIQSPAAFRLGERKSRFSRRQAREVGQEALRAGKVGVLIVAGGQGTRLGYPHPKGTFPIGPVSGHSLLQILIERVVATARRYGASVPLMIMTSPATHEQTVAFLQRHDRFDLSAEDLDIFCQGTMPAVEAQTGKLLLAAPDSLALAPDGHGGMLAALQRSGCLDKAQRRGVEQFSYGQVDNPLVQLAQPELIGYQILCDSDMTTQVIRKRDPWDRVGNVVVIDGQTRIIEYSDLPDDVATARNPDGSLQVWAGSIAVHVFALSFLQRLADRADALPFHRASKKVPYIDEQGVRHVPQQPNAIKFERFIFDLLPWARQPVVVEGDPDEVFAPVKNAEGAASDTPSMVRQAISRLHGRWLQAAGTELGEAATVEISPLWALDAEQVAERADRPSCLDRPTFFQ